MANYQTNIEELIFCRLSNNGDVVAGDKMGRRVKNGQVECSSCGARSDMVREVKECEYCGGVG